MIRNLLLISNSTNAGEPYLAWPRNAIREFLTGHKVSHVLFIPYAGVNLTSTGIQQSYDLYEERVGTIFRELGFNLRSIHHAADPVAAVNEAESVVIGGGNTFHLVAMMHEHRLMEPIRRKVMQGMPYVGWSAGANVACPSMKTTNDMPICQPLSFDCLSLIPFQINPHYLDANPQGHAGETRQQRIEEFLTVNRDVTVAGLREGCLLLVKDDQLQLAGGRPLRVFRFGKEPAEFTSGENLDFLLA